MAVAANVLPKHSRERFIFGRYLNVYEYINIRRSVMFFQPGQEHWCNRFAVGSERFMTYEIHTDPGVRRIFIRTCSWWVRVYFSFFFLLNIDWFFYDFNDEFKPWNCQNDLVCPLVFCLFVCINKYLEISGYIIQVFRKNTRNWYYPGTLLSYLF